MAKEDDEIVISKDFDGFARKFGMSPQVAAGVAAATALAATVGVVYGVNKLARSTLRGVEGVIHGNSVDNEKQTVAKNEINQPPVVVNINNSRS